MDTKNFIELHNAIINHNIIYINNQIDIYLEQKELIILIIENSAKNIKIKYNNNIII